mgnify:CR=1 FL=1
MGREEGRSPFMRVLPSPFERMRRTMSPPQTCDTPGTLEPAVVATARVRAKISDGVQGMNRQSVRAFGPRGVGWRVSA